MDEKVCYCFDSTKADIVADLQLHEGHSTIVDKIRLAVYRIYRTEAKI